MTKKLISGRINEADLISSGPGEIEDLELDIADLLGFASDTLYENSPFGFDSDGNLTRARDGDGIHTTVKDSCSTAPNIPGFRFWDSDNDVEVLIGIERAGGKSYFNILENTGTVGESGTWRQRFSCELSGAAVDDEGQDILDHARMPGSLVANQYLRANSDADALEFAAFDAARPDSCRYYNNGFSIGSAVSWADYDSPQALTEDFDNASMGDNDGTYDRIKIQEAGIYLVNIMGSFPNGMGLVAVGYGESRAVGSGADRSHRAVGGNFDPWSSGGQRQFITGSWVESFEFEDLIYPKLLQYNSGGSAESCGVWITVSKISEE